MNKTRTMYIVLIFSVLGFVILGLAATTAKADAQHRTEYMPCSTDEGDLAEDGFGRNCVWDAVHQGNGLGNSYFINKRGEIFRLPHHLAHFLIHGK